MKTPLLQSIESGIQYVEDWQRGHPAKLVEWQQTLSERGRVVMQQVRRKMSHEQIRAIVTAAVAAGSEPAKFPRVVDEMLYEAGR